MHIAVGTLIFLVCFWAVFSPRVRDGFIGRHLLTFAAISGVGFAYSGELKAFFTSYVLVMLFSALFLTREIWKMRHAQVD